MDRAVRSWSRLVLLFPAMKWASFTLSETTVFARHPDAKDTREGISTWWIRGQRIEQTVPAVFKDLEFLVARDFIVECRGPDLRPYYKINHQRFEEIVRFLEEEKP